MKNMKTYMMALCAGLMLASCADKLEVTPPNNIIDEHNLDILGSADEEKIKLILKALDDNLPTNLISYISASSGVFSSHF